LRKLEYILTLKEAESPELLTFLDRVVKWGGVLAGERIGVLFLHAPVDRVQAAFHAFLEGCNG
jgi:hypothetical protein